jgi:hypothetical protein
VTKKREVVKVKKNPKRKKKKTNDKRSASPILCLVMLIRYEGVI